MLVRSDDIELHYEVVGEGPDIVLLHPFPSSRGYWTPLVERLSSRYRVISYDLRGLGETSPGEGIATMQRHAEDLARLCDELDLGKAVFVGCSIGGYILFEAWRLYRARFRALVLTDTKAAADDDAARETRLRSADDVLLRGPELFISNMLPKLIGATTRRNRPDVVAAARATMANSTAPGIAAIQRGMAARPDSTRTLATIDVPTMIVGGEEDEATPVPVMRQMAQGIRNSEFHLIPAAGHYAAFEKPDDFARLLRQFLDAMPSR